MGALTPSAAAQAPWASRGDCVALATGEGREEERMSHPSLRQEQVRLPLTSCCSLSLKGFHDPSFS